RVNEDSCFSTRGDQLDIVEINLLQDRAKENPVGFEVFFGEEVDRAGVAEDIERPVAVFVVINQFEAAGLGGFFDGALDPEAIHIATKRLIVVWSDTAD